MPLTRQDGDFSQISNIVQVSIPSGPPPDTNFLLQENGFRILQEDGGRIVIEVGVAVSLFASINAAQAPGENPYVGESPLFGLLHPVAFGGVVDVGALIGVSGLACFINTSTNEFTIGFTENGSVTPPANFFQTVRVVDRFGGIHDFNSVDATTGEYNIFFQPIGRFWTWPTAAVLFEDGFDYTVNFRGPLNP